MLPHESHAENSTKGQASDHPQPRPKNAKKSNLVRTQGGHRWHPTPLRVDLPEVPSFLARDHVPPTILAVFNDVNTADA